jgi:hypothetical protein
MANTKPQPVDELLPRIEQVLDLYDISATKFGYFSCGDPAVVLKMRKGRILRVKMRHRVEVALGKIEANGGIQ